MLIPRKYFEYAIGKGFVKKECELTKPVRRYGVRDSGHKTCECPFYYCEGNLAYTKVEVVD